jgi:hypothetical protein
MTSDHRPAAQGARQKRRVKRGVVGSVGFRFATICHSADSHRQASFSHSRIRLGREHPLP